MIKIITALIICISIWNPVLAEPLKVFGNGNLPPMGYVEDGVAKGFGVDITKAVLKEAGIEYELNMGPWARAYHSAKNGNGIVFGMFWTNERSEIFDYSEPLWEEKIVIVTKKGQEFPFQKIADLRNKKISVQRDSKAGGEFAKAIEQKVFKIVENNDPTLRLKLIHHERVDAGIFNPGIASVKWNAERAGLSIEEFSVLEKPLVVTAKHIGIAKSLERKDIIMQINKAIQKLRQNGTLKAIKSRYESGGIKEQ